MSVSLHPTAEVHHKYRPEIDGLRAIAVLAVIIYHLNPAWLPGGFTGVDVFFVISGYLITQQIQTDLQAEAFSLKTFYLRRIRRILPALLVVLIASSVAALFLLTPEDIRSFAKSLLVQPLFLQNVLFLSEGEYFIGAHQKPLLHTWSLAVEEQFYVFWPLLMLFLFQRQWKLPLILGVMGLSFLINLSWSDSSSEAAFFMILSRAWELGLGGLVAILESQRSRVLSLSSWQGKTAIALAWVGLAASFIWFNSRMAFPGWAALIPVCFTCLLIAFSKTNDSLSFRLLSSAPMLKIGLLSYALYLWHWPVLVFMRHLGWQTQQLPVFIAFWLLTVGMAYLSYRWVELPIRKRTLLATTQSLLITVCLAFALLSAFAVHLMLSNGAQYRYEESIRNFLTARIESRNWRCTPWAIIKGANPSICKSMIQNESNPQPRKVMVWGDSHAGMWMPMLEALAREHKSDLYLNKKNCRPVSRPTDCATRHLDQVKQQLEKLQPSDVVLASSWRDIQDPELGLQLAEQVQWLSQRSIRIWLVVDVPSHERFDPLNAYAQDRLRPKLGQIAFEQFNSQRRTHELALFESLRARYPTVEVIDPTSSFCTPLACSSGLGASVWYRDATHLSNAGAFAAKDTFARIFVAR